METKSAREFTLNKWDDYNPENEHDQRYYTLTIDDVVETADEYAKHVTTSQQQTIERLREENRTLKSLIKSLHLYEHAITTDMELEYKDYHYDADTSFLEAQKELIESEQLFNTTEPIDQ